MPNVSSQNRRVATDWLRLVSWVGAILLSQPLSHPALADTPVDFNFDVKTVLSDRCFICHGPDAENREGDLRLDTPDGVMQDSQSGNFDKVISPGKLDESELWLRITSDDPDVMMPPPDSNLKLSKDEIAKLGSWIKQGAEWKQHWSFLPIESSPAARGDIANAIDTLIEAKRKPAGYSSAAVASKEQLIRRATFDLTGLPPTLEEIDAFLADDSPQAYETLVDRLLNSTAYGERMAAQWLDVARYSDTYGYQVDRDRFVWPYRDWVIRAFNKNLPYDQFITEQLAGDLLPEATDDQILATTFNRLHPQKVEGGSVPEEFRIEYVADRTQTFSTAILGLTFECARCHDHKYDPLSQKEYYQLTAFFDKIDEAGLYSYFTPSIPTPTLMLNKVDGKQKLTELESQVERAQQKCVSIQDASQETFEAWLDGEQPSAREPVEVLSFDDLKADGPNKPVKGVVGQAVRLTGDDAINLKQGNFHRFDPFSVSLWLKLPSRRERAVVFHRSPAWTDAASRGYELLIKDGRLNASLIHFWPGNAISVGCKDEFPLNEWHQVTMTYDGSSRASGLRLYLDGEPAETNLVRDNLYKQIRGGGNDHITIGQRFRDLGLARGEVDEFKVFDCELSALEVQHVFDDKSISRTWRKRQQDSEREELFSLFLSQHKPYVEQLAALHEARKQHADAIKDLKEIMVMRETPAADRDTHVLIRGAYDAKGEKVIANTPAVLPPLPADQPRNRLTLAKWLTSPDNPLTARVAVNRLWQLVFGTGLVRTPEDFGSQGQLPTHPELLDQLAHEFVQQGWDIKQMLKQMVMSKTYRQSSIASASLLQSDPENMLYARAPSYRWPAEMLRDQALSLSGLLVDKIGGEPVKPYELAVSFKPAKPDSGEGLYRRSVYTYWKRTGPAPAMMALDAAKRDVCRVKRSLTSSPLQTLVLMNGPQFVEAARGIAERVMKSNETVPQRVQAMARMMIGRRMEDRELTILTQLYETQLTRFTANEDSADEYLSVGETKPSDSINKLQLAALTSVANTLFGLDECMMKR